MSDENTCDIYEETGDSDSDLAYLPFIKIESDGSVYIDGQPCIQDASQMSIESAEVLVLPFGSMSQQFECLDDNDQELIENASDVTVVEAASDEEGDGEDNSMPDSLLHDHNYEEAIRPKEKVEKVRYNFIMEQLQQYRRRTCHICAKVFNSPASMKRHLRTHTGERPYQCQICEKMFSQQSNLWKHVRTHTGERPFECPQCGKSFSQRANMKKHLIIHTGERPFVCYLCNRAFTQQANLSKHMRLHTGEKPFKCSYCEKKFTQRSNLQKHEHLHEGIKPYTCGVCFQAFTQQSNLRKHEMMHNNIKKFVCEVCNKGYVQKISLIKHKQKCKIVIDSQKDFLENSVITIETTIEDLDPEVECLEIDGDASDNNFIFSG